MPIGFAWGRRPEWVSDPLGIGANGVVQGEPSSVEADLVHPWSGGTYVARTSSEDAISTLERLSADGEVEWSRVTGYPESITTLPDGRGLHAGGHDFGGVTLSVGQPDAFPIDSNDHGCYVALYEADGSLAWVRTIDIGPMGGEVFVTSEANQGWFARYMASGELLGPRTFSRRSCLGRGPSRAGAGQLDR